MVSWCGVSCLTHKWDVVLLCHESDAVGFLTFGISLSQSWTRASLCNFSKVWDSSLLWWYCLIVMLGNLLLQISYRKWILVYFNKSTNVFLYKLCRLWYSKQLRSIILPILSLLWWMNSSFIISILLKRMVNFYRVDGSHLVDLFICSIISCASFHNVLVGCALAGYRHLNA